MNNYLKLFLHAFLVWLIPFIVSFLFFKPDGSLAVDYGTFKSAMVVTSSIVGCFFLIKYFMSIKNDYLKNGILLGVIWFAVNIILDLIILVPMAKYSIDFYFKEIGLRYLVMPIYGVAFGYLLEKKFAK